MIQELLKKEAETEEDHSQAMCLDQNGEHACACLLTIAVIMIISKHKNFADEVECTCIHFKGKKQPLCVGSNCNAGPADGVYNGVIPGDSVAQWK